MATNALSQNNKAPTQNLVAIPLLGGAGVGYHEKLITKHYPY
jgi:hypothetical protein